METDSVNKVVQTYFRAVCTEPLTHNGRTYEPRKLVLSRLVYRGYECQPDCAACCPRFSLDYLPEEIIKFPKWLKNKLRTRQVVINDIPRTIHSHLQDKKDTDHWCDFVKKDDRGKCRIHPYRPLSCDFEPLRFTISHSESSLVPTSLSQRAFGRGWAMKRVGFHETTEERDGAICVFKNPKTNPDFLSAGDLSDIIRRLMRLQQWLDYFEINSCLPEKIRQVEKEGWILVESNKHRPKVEPLITGD